MQIIKHCKKVVITGPVGVGKTTIIRNLCARLEQNCIKYHLIPEYIDALPNANEKLEKYLRDEIHSIDFQTYVITYYDHYIRNNLKDINQDTVLIFERVPDDALYCFSYLDYQKGRLTFEEYQKLVDLTNEINQKYNLPSYTNKDCNCLIIKSNDSEINSNLVNELILSSSQFKNNIIGLFNDVKTCMERIQRRNRPGENYNIESVILFNNRYKEIYSKMMI